MPKNISARKTQRLFQILIMNKRQKEQLEKILVNVGDLGFKRRVTEIINGLEIKDNDTILDCGCGEGFYIMAISQLFPKVKIVAFDHDAELMKKAKKWAGSNINIKWVVGDIYNISFKDNTFDKIILSEVLEHIPDDLRALNEVKRVLKPGSTLIITVPNHNYPFFWDPLNWTREHLKLGHFSPNSGFFGGIWAMHLRLYYPQEVKRLAEKAGLKIEKIAAQTHYCLPFNHNILYAGKQLYTKLPVFESVRNTMEKFEWQKTEGKNKKFNLIRMVFKIFEMIDELNNREIKLSESSMGIMLKVIK